MTIRLTELSLECACYWYQCMRCKNSFYITGIWCKIMINSLGSTLPIIIWHWCELRFYHITIITDVVMSHEMCGLCVFILIKLCLLIEPYKENNKSQALVHSSWFTYWSSSIFYPALDIHWFPSMISICPLCLLDVQILQKCLTYTLLLTLNWVLMSTSSSGWLSSDAFFLLSLSTWKTEEE